MNIEKDYEYNYIVWALPLNYLDQNDIKIFNDSNCMLKYYGIISVKFINPHTHTHAHTHKYILEPYGCKIKVNSYSKLNNNLIENNIFSTEFKSSPYVLVKLSNGKFGYIHTDNFDPVEFESQELIRDLLLDFLSNIN